MTKVVEILEALKNRVESLEKIVEQLKVPKEESGEGDKAKKIEEPLPPMTEKASLLGNVFIETLKPTKDSFSKFAKELIY